MPASRAKRATVADRRAKALALRIAGADFAQIALALDYSGAGSARKDIARALELGLAQQYDNADMLRETELRRLDQIQRGLWTAATRGDPRSADTVLRLIDRRIRLLGLDLQPDMNEVMRHQLTVRIAEQMYVVFGRVLDRLGLTPDQRAGVPDLLREMIGGFSGVVPRPAIQATVVEEGERAA
jgi:hypothetical protein